MSRRPHVLMTTDVVGGVLTYALDLGAELRTAGWRVTLALQGPQDAAGVEAARRSGLDVVETDWPLDWLAPSSAPLLAAGAACARLADRLHVDLVHLNTPVLAAAGGFRQPVVGACHSCLGTWWKAVREGPPPPDLQWRIELLRQAYAACDALLAPSFSFVQDTLAEYGCLPTGVRNGRTARPRSGGARKAPHVLTAGRLWDDGKNVAALDAAAGLMRAPVLAAGSLSALGGEVRRPSNLQLLGALSEEALARRMRAAQVFASLSLYEPFGLAVLEAAQAGCALVLSDIPTFRELWDGAAVFVDPRGDPASIAETLDALLQDPARSEDLGRRAEARARAYSRSAMGAGTLELYARVLDRAAPAEAAA